MERRNFLKWASLFGLTGMVKASDQPRFEREPLVPAAKNDREYWSALLDKIATPVLSNMSKGELVKNMEMQVGPTWDKRDKRVGYMEAFGRLIAGLAPFITLPDDNTAESKVRGRLREQTLQSFANGFDPKSPDYLYWGTPQTRQPLVDAAYIAQALITAPEVLWKPLSDTTKAQIVHEFETIRQIKPFESNWLLFAAMIETFLLSIDVKVNAERIDYAIDRITKWYVGDGWYGDGERFHFDHYNGYVMQPMLTEILKVNVAKGRRDKKEFDLAYKRMQRYASFQERYISPEGTYPVVGRSSTYRAGAFWPLVKLVNDGNLPAGIVPAQVRSALTAVFKNLFIPETFTKAGWLQLGLVGDKQQNITDVYTNTGSLYITSLAFLPLGLPASHEFWSGPFTEWTQKKAWSGKQFPKDYAVDY